MRAPVALIIYVVVSIISAIIKKAAENKDGQTKKFEGLETFEGLDLGHDVISFEEIDQDVEVFEEVEDTEETVPLDWELFRSFSETEEAEEEVFYEPLTQKETVSPKNLSFNLKQAVIMSEVLNRPRAQRPWPNR